MSIDKLTDNDEILREFSALNNKLVNTQRKLELKNHELLATNKKLEKALAEIKILKPFLNICMKCKKIHLDDDSWIEIDHYIRLHTDTEFSHGFCEECFRKQYPEIADQILKNKKEKK